MIGTAYARWRRFIRRILTRPRIDLPLALRPVRAGADRTGHAVQRRRRQPCPGRWPGRPLRAGRRAAAAGVAHPAGGAAQLDAVAVRRQHRVAGGGGGAGRRAWRDPLAGSGLHALPAVRAAEADDADDGRLVSASAPAAAGLEGHRDGRPADRDSGRADRRTARSRHRACWWPRPARSRCSCPAWRGGASACWSARSAG